MEQNSVNERINQMVEYFHKGNKSAFAKAAGISNQSLGEIVGARQSAPSFAALQKIIAAFPEVRIEWLVMGRGEMLPPKPAEWVDPFARTSEDGDKRSFFPPGYLEEYHKRQLAAIEEGQKRMDYFEQQLEKIFSSLSPEEAKKMRESKPVFINPEDPALEQLRDDIEHDE
jgi:hypothetical protein